MRIYNVRFKFTTAFLALALIAGATVLSLSRGPGAASAAPPPSRELHVTKDCSAYTGLAGQFCTITSSNLAAITVGSRVVYASAAGATSLDSDVVLVVGPSDTAFGHCALNLTTGIGLCTFSGGTGKFTGFHASVDVSPPKDGVNWHWDGTYSLADITFTKWVTQATAFPWDMKGVVGGDVGVGTLTGEVLSLVDDGTTTKIHALYHVNGGKQSLTADLQVTQIDATGAAVLNGVVTVGYLKDSQVTGEYKTLTTCDIPTPGNALATVTPVANPCFKGTLHIIVAPTTAPTVAPTTAPTVAPPLAPKPPATGNGGFANRGGGTSQAVVWLVGIATAGLVLAGGRRLVSRRSSR